MPPGSVVAKEAMTRAMNFNAGPGTLPLPALEQARDELLDVENTGASILEHSHRGKTYEAIHDEAAALLRELAAIPADYEVLFLQGGASMQFALLPTAFLGRGARADYVVNGVWGEKALAEARLAASLAGADVRVAADTAEGEGAARTYTRVPAASEVKLDPEAAYVHVTSNETIHGVQFAPDEGAAFPSFGARPLVCDMSSDFLWKPLDVSRFAFLYAGAQKNVGPSGLCVVVAHREFLKKERKDLPKIFRYGVHAENRSLYNTPPTFAVYLVRNVLAWAKAQGGLPAMEVRNRRKARRLYGVLDAHSSFYRCPVAPGSRSVMNVVFRLPSPALEEQFLSEAKAAGMMGLKGHRSVGGIRVSLYNAVEPTWVEALAAFAEDFAARHGGRS